MKKHVYLLFIFLSFSILSIGKSLSTNESTLRIVIQDEFGVSLPQVEASLKDKNDATIWRGISNANGELFLPENKGEVIYLSRIGLEDLTIGVDLLKADLKVTMRVSYEEKETVLIQGIRANKNTPGTFTNISKKEIEQVNYGQDLPILLRKTISTVTHSDAGAGVGYTGLRIRGVDPTRINVTINGVALNDAESHGVFWVNMPDFASSVQSIQVQRGVGTSTNGSAAFGASINIKTDQVKQKAFGAVDMGLGSFNTNRIGVQFGSGITEKGWGIQGRISQIKSDGFIDRASSDLRSIFLTTSHYGKKDIFKVNVILGSEKTYQAWGGIPQPKFKQNKEELNAFVSLLGIGGADLENLLSSNYNTYNSYTYSNETDNYNQNHYQALYNRKFTKNLSINYVAHLTTGKGYYEQLKRGEAFEDYGLKPVIISDSTITNTDLVRRLWLDNINFGGVITSTYKKEGTEINSGLAGNVYDGLHFGEITWAQMASDAFKDERFYENNARKLDANVFVKINQKLFTYLTGYVDVQFRSLTYLFEGFNRNLEATDQEVNYLFFNPKLGLSRTKGKSKMYVMFGRTNREPVRDDFVNSTPTSRPEHETLNNLELGWERTAQNHNYGANYYLMSYSNQLILTGEINDVGAFTRQNVESSYRTGLELFAAKRITKRFEISTNATISSNKVVEFTEFVEDWDNGGFVEVKHENTNLAFSPNLIGYLGLSYKLGDKFVIESITKYVGDQYLDNTQSENRKLDSYLVTGLQSNYEVELLGLKTTISAQVNNLLNIDYAPNGYTFGGVLGGARQSFNYVYPMAGINGMLRLSVKF